MGETVQQWKVMLWLSRVSIAACSSGMIEDTMQDCIFTMQHQCDGRRKSCFPTAGQTVTTNVCTSGPIHTGSNAPGPILMLVACSVNSPVATMGFLRPNLLRFSRRVW